MTAVACVATTASAVAGTFWIRVVPAGNVAVIKGFGPPEPSYTGPTVEWPGFTGHIVGFFDAPVGNPVEIIVSDATNGAALATFSAAIGTSHTYWYSGFRLPKSWAGKNLLIQAKTTTGTTTYISDTTALYVWKPPPPPPPPPPAPAKPPLSSGVGSNTLAGAGAGAVANLLGGGPVTIAGTVFSGGGWVALSAAGGALGSGLGTFIWNVGVALVDPDGPEPRRIITGALAMAVLGFLILTVPVLAFFAARRRWGPAAAFLAIHGVVLCILAYVPLVPLSRAPLFYAFPWIAAALAGATAWIATRRPPSATRMVLQIASMVLLAALNFGIVATIVDFASAWAFLRSQQFAVGVWFALGAILVEHSVSQRT